MGLIQPGDPGSLAVFTTSLSEKGPRADWQQELAVPFFSSPENPMYTFFSVRWGTLWHHSGTIAELPDPLGRCRVLAIPAGWINLQTHGIAIIVGKSSSEFHRAGSSITASCGEVRSSSLEENRRHARTTRNSRNFDRRKTEALGDDWAVPVCVPKLFGFPCSTQLRKALCPE
jgi:hypothetical protein